MNLIYTLFGSYISIGIPILARIRDEKEKGQYKKKNTGFPERGQKIQRKVQKTVEGLHYRKPEGERSTTGGYRNRKLRKLRLEIVSPELGNAEEKEE